MAVFDRGSKIPAAPLFMPEPASHTVRVIKAADAAALLPPDLKTHDHPTGPRKPTEVRLVGSGPDYADLEFICGCGEVTRFRCWNSPGAGTA